MYGCGFGGPPFGIPIPKEIHRQYSPDLKLAWKTFDSWWKRACKEAKKNNGQISRKAMPAFVKAAMDLILETPIPGIEEATGADSCSMIFVQMNLVD